MGADSPLGEVPVLAAARPCKLCDLNAPERLDGRIKIKTKEYSALEVRLVILAFSLGSLSASSLQSGCGGW